MKELDETIRKTLSEAKTTTARYSSGVSIEIDAVTGIPVGYEKFSRVGPGGGKSAPASFGKGYRTFSPRRSGYEIYAYPKVKKYVEIYTT